MTFLVQVLPASLKLRLFPGDVSMSLFHIAHHSLFSLAPVLFSWDPSVAQVPLRNADGSVKDVSSFRVEL